jgi:phage terminase large subunit-like protein
MRPGPKGPLDGSRLPFTSPKRGAERFASFCRQYLTVPRGHDARKRLRLRPWQVELVASVMDAAPRPRLAGWMLPRGSGKTSLVAALGLYELLCGPEGATVILVATDFRQAGLCFGVARRMVELDERLDTRVHTYSTRLEVPGRGASLRVLTAVPKRLEGQDFTLAILDEFGRMDRDVYEVITLASGKQPASVAIGIGTPPPDPATSVLTTIRTYAADHPDDGGVIWREHSAAGFEDHPVTCRHCWTLANPSLGDFLAVDGLAACLPPVTREASFRRARLCQMVDELAASWLPPGAWAACADPTPIGVGTDVVLGFDGSYQGDCTALVVCTIAERPHLELVELWETDGAPVPITEVEDAIRLACSRWRVREIACDTFRWQRSFQVLEAEGLPVVAFPQSPSRMTPATTRFYEAVVNGTLSHSGDQRLSRHVDNCVLREDSRGVRVAKQSKMSTRRIDAAVASIMAADRAAGLAGDRGPSIYVFDD